MFARCLLLWTILSLFWCCSANAVENTRGQEPDASTAEMGVETDAISDKEAREIASVDKQRLQAQARKRRLQREREKEGVLAAKATLEAASTDKCDWKLQPLSLVKGQVCGTHYKVLGLDRKREDLDDDMITAAYRAKSIVLDPDKNPAMEAKAALKAVSDAYACLIDSTCRAKYDIELDIAEKQVLVDRSNFKDMLMAKSVKVLRQVHYYCSIAANQIYQTGMSLWDLAGEIEAPIMGEMRPVGRAVMIGALLVKGRLLLKLHGLAYAILRTNYELAQVQRESTGRGYDDDSGNGAESEDEDLLHTDGEGL
jgi:hypothetical protein